MSYQRLENLRWVQKRLVSCLRELVIVNYHPGEVWYNHNEYPALPHRRIGEEDAVRFEDYRSNGVEIIKLHQEWADALGICGGDTFTSNDPKGLNELVRLAHESHLRVHLYFSSGFLDYRDPAFRPEWTGLNFRLDEAYWRNTLCSPFSPGWRGHLMSGISNLLDTYDVDGLYNDCGFSNHFHPWFRGMEVPNADLVADAFTDTRELQPSFEDLLGELYALLKIKRPSGLMTVHFGGNRRPPIAQKHYDVLYVGEGVDALQDLCAKTKEFDPFTMLIPDARLGDLGPRAVYAGGMPYLQFPVLYDGAPMTGERVLAPGVDYLDPSRDYWRAQMLRVHELRKAGAEPTYGWWDRIPGDPRTKPTYFHFLKIWRKIASNGSRMFMEVELENCWREVPRHVVQSILVNDAIYLVISNMGDTEVTLFPRFDATDMETGEVISREASLVIPPQDLKVLNIYPLDDTFGNEPESAAPHHLKI